jgi:hypothetical protein
MTASPESRQNPGHTPLAWGVVGLASCAAVLVALGIGGLGGGGAGAVLSLAAFVTAVVAKVKHERWALLWLPLLLLPVLLASAPFWV